MSSLITAAMISAAVSPPKQRAARQHLEQHHAERPDVRALVDGPAARLLRRHVGGGAEDHAALGARRRRRASGEFVGARRALDSRSSAFARPKSSTFTTPSGVILMLAGFRSRWTMPFSCAASSASAICARDGEGVGQAEPSAPGVRAAAMPSASVGAWDELHHQVVGPDVVERADVRMVERGKRPRLALEARAEYRPLEDLDRDVATEPSVARAVDLAHPARADGEPGSRTVRAARRSGRAYGGDISAVEHSAYSSLPSVITRRPPRGAVACPAGHSSWSIDLANKPSAHSL